MIFEYRGPGAPKGISASVAGAELQRIYQQHGEIIPSVVVEESKPLTAPLHGAFEWDVKKAAQAHWEDQARAIVRSVVIVSQPEKGEQAPVIRAFVSLSKPEEQHKRFYKPTIDVLENPDETEEVLKRFRHELIALRRRYMDLLETSQMVQAATEELAS